jgi:hypothetical protein
MSRKRSELGFGECKLALKWDLIEVEVHEYSTVVDAWEARIGYYVTVHHC